MDFSNYKFRCSSLGKLMTNARSKSEPLSETTKSYLREIYIEEVYDRRRDTTSKYTEKGLYVEDQSINLIQKYYGDKVFMIKNKERFANEYIQGTPDIIDKKILKRIIDAKSSWDIWTFMEADGSNKDYFYQGQGYMELLEVEDFTLAYCLSDAPEHLILDEKKKQMRRYELMYDQNSPAFDEMMKQVEKNMIFFDIPEEKRVKVFDFKRDREVYNKIVERIIICREYLNTLKF